MRLTAIVLIPALLAGCAVIMPPPLAVLPDPSACGAADLQNVVGLSVRVLPPTGPWSTLRVLRPGDVMTMDYSATRLNVMVDGNDRILQLTCG